MTVCFYASTSVWPTDWLSSDRLRIELPIKKFLPYPPWPAFDFPWHTYFPIWNFPPLQRLSCLRISLYLFTDRPLSFQPWPVFPFTVNFRRFVRKQVRFPIRPPSELDPHLPSSRSGSSASGCIIGFSFNFLIPDRWRLRFRRFWTSVGIVLEILKNF